MKRAALGFRAHSGWTALVAIGLEKGEPAVLSRERVQLVETFSGQFKQPYHAAAQMAHDAGGNHIEQVKSAAQRLAHDAVHSVQSQLEKAGYRLERCALLAASGRPLPNLERILASHSLIHSAEGELFREVVARACEECGIEVHRLREKELISYAAQSLKCTEAAILKRATVLGKPLGSPWSKDQKFATLAAWLALSRKGAGKLASAKAKSA